ncbi:hypothetical protein BH23GEM2_BH23GEM2_06400 [soil metagenome]
MSHSAVIRPAFTALAIALILGCNRGEEAPMVPLGQAGSGQAAGGPTITGEAKVALDSANNLFRAREYELALAQYRRSAQLVPNDVTPLLGVLMVAEATSDSQLAETTMSRIRQLNPSVADTSVVPDHSQLVDLHSRVRATPPPQP